MRTRALWWAGLLLVGCGDDSSTPDPGDGAYGDACEASADCASGLCLAGPEPFCTMECPDDCACPGGATCAPVTGGGGVCAPGVNGCVGDPDAGRADGGATDAGGRRDAGPAMSGGGPGAACGTASDCAEVLSLGGTGPRPDRMRVAQECAAWVPGGFCSLPDCVTNVRRDPCPDGTECVSFRGGSLCLVECDRTSECREGFVCRDDVDPVGGVCWQPCSVTGCPAELTCAPTGDCRTPDVPDVEYDVSERSIALDGPLSDVDGRTTESNLAFDLPFDVTFYGETYRAGTDVAASWQGLFAFGRRAIMSFVPGDHTRYEPNAPLVVAHHTENLDAGGGSVAYRVSGTSPDRALEIEWVTAALSGTGGARFRLRFEEGSDAFVVHYGPITDDIFGARWTQLAMLDGSRFEEVVVSTGSPSAATAANTRYTYTPR